MGNSCVAQLASRLAVEIMRENVSCGRSAGLSCGTEAKEKLWKRLFHDLIIYFFPKLQVL